MVSGALLTPVPGHFLNTKSGRSGLHESISIFLKHQGVTFNIRPIASFFCSSGWFKFDISLDETLANHRHEVEDRERFLCN